VADAITRFYQAVDLYQLDQALPGAALVLAGLLLLTALFRALFPNTEWMGAIQGLVGAFLLFTVLLSLPALEHVHGDDWDRALRSWTATEPAHWYWCAGLLAAHLAVLAFGALKPVPRAKDTHPERNDSVGHGLAIGLLFGLGLAALVVAFYAFAFRWLDIHEALRLRAGISLENPWGIDPAVLLSLLFTMLLVGVLYTVAGLNGVARDVPAMLQGMMVALLVLAWAFFFYVATYYWYPTWQSRLHFVIPTCAMGVVLLICLSYVFVKWYPKLFYTNYWQQAFCTFLLIVLAYFAIGNYYNWGNWRYNAFVNAYEFYHYYIGAKYSPEVGYFHMYEATLLADQTAEAAKPIFTKSHVRNLETGRKTTSTQDVLNDADRIRGYFSEARWQEFLIDIRWFKEHLVPSRFSGMIGDKGYNATPVWTLIVGGVLSENIPTSEPPPWFIDYPMSGYRAFMNWVFAEEDIVRPDGTIEEAEQRPLYPGLRTEPDGEPNGMLFLALIDQMMILAALMAVWWAFGFRATLLMIIVLGTSYVMKFSHMKGAYLRTDFCMALILGICMLKKDKYGWAGVFLAYGFLSRVFPAVIFFGVAANLLWHFAGLLPRFGPALAKNRWTLLLPMLVPILLGSVAFVALLPLIALTLGVSWTDAAIVAAIGAGGFAVLALVLTPLLGYWYWAATQGPRAGQYFKLFASATVTVLFMIVTAFLYHSAAKPDHHVIEYNLAVDEREIIAAREQGVELVKAGETNVPALVTYLRSTLPPEEDWRHRIWNAFAEQFDGGLVVFGEYAKKIGDHNDGISPWRVGLKYWYIGEGRVRPYSSTADAIHKRWKEKLTERRAEAVKAGAQGPVDIGMITKVGLLATSAVEMLSAYQSGDEDFIRKYDPAYGNPKQAGSFERIRSRAMVDEYGPDTTFWEAVWEEFSGNKTKIRSAILSADEDNADIYRFIQLMALVLSLFLVAGLKDHEATAYGFVIAMFLVSATYYYFIFLLVPLLFFSPHLHRPTRVLGVLFILLVAWPGYYMNYIMGWKQGFPTYYYHTVMYMVLVFYMMFLAGGETTAMLWKKYRRRKESLPPAAA